MRWIVLVLAVGCSTTEPNKVDRSGDGLEEWNGDWAWPLGGQTGKDWVVNNYVDLEQGPGMEDWAGRTGDDARTYDDHLGVDIDVSTFREMDAGTPIFAVMGGYVNETHDGEYDRNTACLNHDWNYVQVEQDDGYTVIYGHMRVGSVSVDVGERVEAGAQLGLVGSSGCSTQPHLHLETWDGLDLVDPYKKGLWSYAPPYGDTLTIMDVIVRKDGVDTLIDVIDPGGDATEIDAGGDVGFAVSAANGHLEETLTFELYGPGGKYDTQQKVLDSTPRHHWYWWNYTLGDAGRWNAVWYLNGKQHAERRFEVK